MAATIYWVPFLQTKPELQTQPSFFTVPATILWWVSNLYRNKGMEMQWIVLHAQAHHLGGKRIHVFGTLPAESQNRILTGTSPLTVITACLVLVNYLHSVHIFLSPNMNTWGKVSLSEALHSSLRYLWIYITHVHENVIVLLLKRKKAHQGILMSRGDHHHLSKWGCDWKSSLSTAVWSLSLNWFSGNNVEPMEKLKRQDFCHNKVL